MRKPVSLTRAAEILGVSRGTLADWIARGCPFVSRADKARGVEWQLDTAAVFKWRVDGCVKDAVASYQTEDGGTSKEEADRRRAVALAIVAEVEADQARKTVVYVEDVGRIVEAEYGLVRQSILGMSSKTAYQCVGRDLAAIKIILDRAADEVLSHLSSPDAVAGKAA